MVYSDGLTRWGALMWMPLVVWPLKQQPMANLTSRSMLSLYRRRWSNAPSICYEIKVIFDHFSGSTYTCTKKACLMLIRTINLNFHEQVVQEYSWAQNSVFFHRLKSLLTTGVSNSEWLAGRMRLKERSSGPHWKSEKNYLQFSSKN